jgi:hypothetical protein
VDDANEEAETLRNLERIIIQPKKSNQTRQPIGLQKYSRQNTSAKRTIRSDIAAKSLKLEF